MATQRHFQSAAVCALVGVLRFQHFLPAAPLYALAFCAPLGVWLDRILPGARFAWNAARPSLPRALPALTEKAWSTKTKGTKPYTAAQKRGKAIYKREGCWYCHTQQVRTLKADTAVTRSGWRGDQTWGRRVRLPEGFAQEISGLMPKSPPMLLKHCETSRQLNLRSVSFWQLDSTGR